MLGCLSRAAGYGRAMIGPASGGSACSRRVCDPPVMAPMSWADGGGCDAEAKAVIPVKTGIQSAGHPLPAFAGTSFVGVTLSCFTESRRRPPKEVRPLNVTVDPTAGHETCRPRPGHLKACPEYNEGVTIEPPNTDGTLSPRKLVPHPGGIIGFSRLA